MTELIICEKPQSAKKIAEALADAKSKKENTNGVPYYRISRRKKHIIVACAVGHLYGLEEKKGNKRWTYPAFEIEWRPAYESKKESAFTKKYLDTIKKLSKESTEFTVATDYDIEGEVIGLNIIRYACCQKDAARMKFSTLTREDLINAYENRSKHIDWGQAQAGETRHYLDWYNGINYSRALTAAIKSTGNFKIMSIGRVQGPALKIIVSREKEISSFKPVPYWEIELSGKVKKGIIQAWHIKDKFWEKKEADIVMKKVDGQKEGIIWKLESTQFKQHPPFPFDLTTLQTELYRCHKIEPKHTLEIAQDLYTSGYISYPRTSSQQYPASINYKKILSSLTKNPEFEVLANKILKMDIIKPNNGSKTDPAHPAIYPTGIVPKNLDSQQKRVYDIIARRFLATFGEQALRETNIIEVNVNEELFLAKGTRTVEKGWHIFYQPYLNLEEQELPQVEKGDIVNIKDILLHDKETQPPKRYTPASIIKELERHNLGTKATRASIIDTLYQRGYITGKFIEATELGIKTIETLAKHSPKIIDEQLTRHFEEEMESIREGKTKEEEILEEAKQAITHILAEFKEKEKNVGKELNTANIETRKAMTTLGDCPACKKGKLHIRKGKFGQFAACNLYPECKTTFSLPHNALIKPSEKKCETCGFPMVQSIKKGKRPMEFCLNPECKSKYLEGEAGIEAKAIAKGKIEKACPLCKEGKLVLRKSIYGTFLACNRYPQCKYTETLGNQYQTASNAHNSHAENKK